MGYTVESIVKKTVSLSSRDIAGYISHYNESQYWIEHRRDNMSLFTCALYAGIMIGHFSAIRVLEQEAQEFLSGNCLETEFTIVTTALSESEPHFLYISSVVVRKAFQQSSIPLKLIRKAYRILLKYMKTQPKVKGVFAEAYSDEGRRMCRLFGMTNSNDNFFVRNI